MHAGRDESSEWRDGLLGLWWALLAIVAVILLAAAVVNAPILVVPIIASLAVAWRQRDRWNWSGSRTTAAAILLVVLVSFLLQRLIS
jgi:uncharacterized membrane protein YfcA